MKLKIFFIVSVFLIAPPVLAHEVSEEVSGPLSILIAIWNFHDAVHWMISLPFIGTCYYFRYLSARAFKHPKVCGLNEAAVRKYKGELFLVKFHRVFFWLMLIFILIHFTEAIAKVTGTVEYNFAILKPYLYPFTSEPTVSQTATVQLFGTIAEWVYVIGLSAFLMSCYYFRYFIGGKGICYSCSFGRLRGDLYLKQTKLNNYHGILFWLSIIFSLFLLFMGGHL